MEAEEHIENPSQRHSDGTFAVGNQCSRGHWFEPGKSGNPSGAPVGQVYPGRWLGPLSDLDPSEWESIVAERKGSGSKIAAAQLLLDMINDDPNVRRRAFAEVCDRTAGKAHQSITKRIEDNRTPKQMLDMARRLAGVETRRSVTKETDS